MDILFEIIFEIIFEGSLEISSNRRISKWIRYPLIVLLAVFFLAVIGLFFWLGIKMFDENIFIALFFIAIGLLLLIMSIVKFRKKYLRKSN